MNTQTFTLPANDNILTILNFNKIANDLKREAVKAMGMAACQARCLSCGHCSAQRCGNR